MGDVQLMKVRTAHLCQPETFNETSMSIAR